MDALCIWINLMIQTVIRFCLFCPAFNGYLNVNNVYSFIFNLLFSQNWRVETTVWAAELYGALELY